MKVFYLIKKSLIISLLSLILACGAETIAAIVFIPAFTATWPVVGGNGYSFSIQSDEEGEESGEIFGAEIDYPNDIDGLENPFTGSFNGLDIEFTVTRDDDSKVKFSGKMVPKSNEDHQIIRYNLSSPEGNIVLSFD
ncbi:hypothetical protein [Tamlana crocina]|uniref:Uncharacterized protein n=1 Tax=Tamlana crocina TaxID=393006 RepID=A0ABX1D9A6_9FLAO|nr:hypothetical protein [Tamlana crocina]NJX14921.1 hypothetical protein [Tamlana crocina]